MCIELDALSAAREQRSGSTMAHFCNAERWLLGVTQSVTWAGKPPFSRRRWRRCQPAEQALEVQPLPVGATPNKRWSRMTPRVLSVSDSAPKQARLCGVTPGSKQLLLPGIRSYATYRATNAAWASPAEAWTFGLHVHGARRAVGAFPSAPTGGSCSPSQS